MRPYTFGLVLGAAFAVVGGCTPVEDVSVGVSVRMDSATQIQIEAEHLQFLKSQLALHELWSSSALGGDHIRSITMTDRELLVVTGMWRLYSMNRMSGLINWVFQLRHPLATHGTDRRLVEPVCGDELIYVLYHGDILGAIWRTTGKPRWLKKVEAFTPGSTLTGNDFYVFLGALDVSRMYAFRESDQGIAWDIPAHDSIVSGPVVADPTVYFADLQGMVFGVNAATGRASWTRRLARGTKADLYLHGGTLYVGCLDHTCYALDRFSGHPRWEFHGGGPVVQRPTVGGDTCYVRIEDVPDRFGQPGEPALVAIDDAKGTERWRLPRGERLLFRGAKVAYVLREGGVMVAVENDTGRVLMPAPDMDGWPLQQRFGYLLTNDQDDILYLATTDGFFFAMQEKNPKPYR